MSAKVVALFFYGLSGGMRYAFGTRPSVTKPYLRIRNSNGRWEACLSAFDLSKAPAPAMTVAEIYISPFPLLLLTSVFL